jgi:DNA-binding protein HU-beta
VFESAQNLFGLPLAAPVPRSKESLMNTNDLIERVAVEHGIAKDHTRKILDSIIAAITAAASAGDEVRLAGFGGFKVTDRAERQGRNPATGETMTIAASKKLTFRPAKHVRDALATASVKRAAAE